MEYKDFYVRYPDALEEAFNTNRDYAYPVSLFDYESYDFDAYQNSREIRTLADDMYELIPEEYKFQEERISSFSNQTYISNKDIRINSYIFVK
jgi:hypothetical protein